MKTIEQRVSDTILQSTTELEVGGRVYIIHPPTTAALIRASAAASKLPRVALSEDANIVEQWLRIGKDCAPIGEVVAALITDTRGAYSSGKAREDYEKRVMETTATLLESHTPTELSTLASTLMSSAEVGSFFALTTFLTEINMTKATKVVTTTAFGQQ